MARARSLKPSFFLNETLAGINPLGRLLFQGLWCHADRAGRLEDRPQRLKVAILPYDPCKVDDLLQILVKHGFITRFEVDGNRYIQIINFEKHQNPHVREPASTIPAPVLHSDSLVPNVLLPLTFNPVPLTLNPEPGAPPVPSSAFEQLWKKYPKRDGRKEAQRYFNGSVKTATDWTDIQGALSNYLRSSTVKKGFVKNGSTWFNNWRDWVDYTEVTTNAPNGGESITEWLTRNRAKIADAKVRELPAPRPVLAGSRDLPDVQIEPGPDLARENGKDTDHVL